MDETTKKLLSTTDALVWAEEFAKVCPEVDQGLMIAWFANAMCVAADAERRKIAESIMGFPITIDIERLVAAAPPSRPTTDGGQAIMLVDEVRWPEGP